MELDSHADACEMGGQSSVPIGPLIVHVSVTAFLKDLGAIDKVAVQLHAVAYDCLTSGNTYILAFHQSLSVPGNDENLLCPLQMRYNRLVVNKCLKHLLDREPTDDDHEIIVNEDKCKLTIRLELNGVSSGFPTQKLTKEEVKNDLIKWIEMMAQEPEWNSSIRSFKEERRTMDEHFRVHEEDRENMRIFCVDSGIHYNLGSFITALRNISEDGETDERTSKKVSTSKAKYKMTASHLSNTWGIGLKTAQKTIQATTQRGLHSRCTPH